MNCALSCDQAGCIVFACVLYVGGCVWSRAMHIGCMYEANVDALTGEIGTPRAVRTTNKRREEKRTEQNRRERTRVFVSVFPFVHVRF